MTFSFTSDDLYSFNPTSNTWTTLTAANPPSSRIAMGFAATSDGFLYVFGGQDKTGPPDHVDMRD